MTRLFGLSPTAGIQDTRGADTTGDNVTGSDFANRSVTASRCGVAGAGASGTRSLPLYRGYTGHPTGKRWA